MTKELETRARRTIAPAADICEDEGKVRLRLEMPGVGKEDLEVKIENDELTVLGKRPEGADQGKYIIRERRREDFLKRFTLDDTIDREKVDAEIKNGVLFVTLSTKESSKPKKIEIKAS